MTEEPVKAGPYGTFLMLLIVVFIGKIQEVLPFLGAINIGKIAVAFGVLFMFAAPRSDLKPIRSIEPVKYLLGILVLAVLSCPFSVWPGGSIEFLTEMFSKSLLFFLMVIVLSTAPGDIGKLIWGLALSSLALSVMTLIFATDARKAITGSYDPNDLAFVLVTFLPLIFYYAKNTKGFSRLALNVIMLVMLLACLKTVSRGGLLGLAVIGCAYLVKNKANVRQALIPLIIGGIFFMAFAPESYWERMSSIVAPKEDYNMTASTGRVEVWKRGITLMLKHPVLGSGVKMFEVAEGAEHEGAGKWSSAHNSFIQIGAEIGVIGLWLFIKMLLSSIRLVRELHSSSGQRQAPEWLLNGIEIAFYGYVTTGFFLSQAYSPILLFLIALTAVTVRLYGDTRTEAVPAPMPRRAGTVQREKTA